MKTLIFIILLCFTVGYWDEVSNFVSSNFRNIGNHTARWLVDHTPKN